MCFNVIQCAERNPATVPPFSLGLLSYLCVFSLERSSKKHNHQSLCERRHLRLSDFVVGGEYLSHANKGISAHWLSSVLILEKSVVVTHRLFFRLSDAKNSHNHNPCSNSVI